MRNSNNAIDFLILMLMILAPSIRLIVPGLNTLILFAMLPTAMAYYMLTNRFRLGNKTLGIYVGLLFWLLLTCITSTNIEHSFVEFRALIGGGIGSIIAYYLCTKKPSNSYWIFLGYILLLASTIYYLHTENLLVTLDSDTERLEDELVNANDLAYYLFYVTIGWTIICHNLKLNAIFSILGNLIIISILLFLSIVTASRQMLMIVLPFFVYSVYFLYLRGQSSFKKILITAICGIMAFFIYSYFMDNMFEGSFLEKRMEINIEDDTRSALLEDALNTGARHPFFGIGPGNMIFYSNDGGFSHNSYLELFATTGFFGTILFVWMILSFIKMQIKRYRVTRNPMFMYLIITTIVWALYNNLYVFYSGIWLITFFFVLCGFSDATYRRDCEQLSTNLITTR